MANTVWNSADKHANITLSGGNLIATLTTAATGSVRAVDRQLTGKFYWECAFTTSSGAAMSTGVASSTVATTGSLGTLTGVCVVARNGSVINDTTTVGGIAFGTITSGMVMCVAVDCATRLVWFRLGAGGLWNMSAGANPATGVGGVSLSIGAGIPIYPISGFSALNDAITANFGDTAFTGAVPSGYTSGFTAGASVPTNALASQALAEHWLTTNPDARITQVVAEHWASVASDNLQAVVTFVALEHWTSVAVVVPAAGGPMVTMIH